MEFSEELRHEYERIGRSQRELAEMLEVPLRTFQDWIRGLRRPPKYTQDAVLDILKRL